MCIRDRSFPLLNSNGGASGITYTGSGFAATQDHTASPLQLLKSYSYNETNPATITFSGLSTEKLYNIVLAATGSNLDSTVSIPGYGSQTTANADSGSSSFILDGNYVEFLHVAPTSGSITVNIAPGPSGNNYYACLLYTSRCV